jgi:hypothetical protein
MASPPFRWLIAEGLFCWSALLAVAVWADNHSGCGFLATLPALMFGLPLFLLHWLLPGTFNRSLDPNSAPQFGSVAVRAARSRFLASGHATGAPESQFRAVTGIPLPTGISNLHSKLWFGPVGGGGVVYLEGPPSVLKQLIERHQLEVEPFDNQARPPVPAELPQPGPFAWQSHRSLGGRRPGGSHLQVFSSTNSTGVYVFTGY